MSRVGITMLFSAGTLRDMKLLKDLCFWIKYFLAKRKVYKKRASCLWADNCNAAYDPYYNSLFDCIGWLSSCSSYLMWHIFEPADQSCSCRLKNNGILITLPEIAWKERSCNSLHSQTYWLVNESCDDYLLRYSLSFSHMLLSLIVIHTLIPFSLSFNFFCSRIKHPSFIHSFYRRPMRLVLFV